MATKVWIIKYACPNQMPVGGQTAAEVACQPDSRTSLKAARGDPIDVAYGGATWRVMFEKNYRSID